jgi:hypothetical protein
MNEGMRWLDNNADAVVVVVTGPVDGHVELLTNNHSNKNHYNNCSGDKQSNSQTLVPLSAIPHKEDCHEQRNGEATDNNAKSYLGNQCHW